ncbi:DUF2141 domain-containing protein [Thalassotalea atypica]|uniref:DUF2141 domain-containing protein n=1 Tax=Thalassotalea atypica TaxID=2054316 RepID=UPI00257357B4|nr:DUF2141 domain-containing protein [Thalassotalea atypica]
MPTVKNTHYDLRDTFPVRLIERLTKVFAIILVTSVFAKFTTAVVSAAEINFEISGVNSNQGKLYVQLFKGEDNYENAKPESAAIVIAKHGVNNVSFNNLNEGEYALRFFHDENDDGKMATNLLGFPVEGYGFSNNAIPNFGPVSYQDIKFNITRSDEKVTNKTQVIY